MKTKLIFRILLFVFIALSCYNCSKQDDETSTGNDMQLNKIVGTINGKDTVINIEMIYITTFSKFLSYNLTNQELSVISSVPANGGIQIDFYANDTVAMKVNKKHYVIDPFHARNLGICTGYFHKYTSVNSFPQTLYASASSEDYYCIITKLEDKVIQGEVKYMVNNVLFSGKFYSDKLVYKLSDN